MTSQPFNPVRISRLLLSLWVGLALSACSPARADGPLAVETGVLTPATPSYIDPMMLAVTVTAGTTTPTGMITYNVDNGAAQTATLTNGVAVISLGAFAPGAHTVNYSYSGSAQSTANQQIPFTTTDLPFSFVASEQDVIYNHGGFAGAAADSNNIFYLTNSSENNLYKLDTLRNLTVVPTTGLSAPQGIAVDGSNNLFIADMGNNRIVELTPAGVQTVVPVTGLSGPRSLAFDRAHANLYINDYGNGRIVQYVVATGVQSTVVTGIPRITGLAVDFSGNLYFGQHYSYQDGSLYRLDPSGNITNGYFGLRSPEDLAIDRQGNLYSSGDYDGLNRIDTQGHLLHYNSFTGSGIAVDGAGDIFYPGAYSYVVTPGVVANLGSAVAFGLSGPNSGAANVSIDYQVPSGQTVSSLDSTTGGYGNTGNYGPSCQQYGQCAVTVNFGPVYPGRHTGYLIAKLASGATLQTNFYGVGLASNEAFDPGVRTSTKTTLTSAGGMVEAEDGTIYVSDTAANKVYSLGIGGTSTPVALAFTGLSQPTQLAVDGAKTVYVLDSGNNRIVSVNAAGTQATAFVMSQGNFTRLTAFALDGSATLYLGGSISEYGPAVASFSPTGVLNILASTPANPALLGLDGLGNLYETDASSGTLTRYSSLLSTAPAAVTVASGVGTPSAMTVEPSGTVFLAQGSAGTVLQVRPDGTTAVLYSGLGNAGAVVEDGRGVLTVADGSTGNLLLDDRRTMTYAFGNQAINTTSAPITSTITNDGNQVLSGIGGLPGDSTFKQVIEANACTSAVPDAGTALPLGAFCKLDYTFTPASVYAYSETGDEQDSTDTPGSDFTYRPLQFTGTGTAGPLAVVSPASLSFGNSALNAPSIPLMVTLSNNGNATLLITSTAVTGAAFSIYSNTCGTSLAATATCTVYILFKPTVAGPATGSLVFTDNSSDTGTQTVALSGNGLTGPTLTAVPNPVNFPDTTVNTTSAGITVTLTNTGGSTLNFQTTIGTLGGADPTAFSFGSFCGYQLMAGSSCSLTVNFTPNAARTFSATLSIPSNDPNSPTLIALTGKGIAAGVLSIAPVTQTFPGTAIGASSAIQTSIISNGTSQAVYLSSGSLTDATDFTQSDNCNGILSAGGTCTVSFKFTPQTSGALSSTYAIHNLNTPNSPLNVALSGNGTAAPAPQASLTPAIATFASITAGTTSAAQTFTLSNAGNAALPITSVGLGGTNPSSFSIASNTCSASLAAGANCVVMVTFNAPVAGSYAATLTVVDSVGTQTSALSGTATAVPVPVATLTPATLTFTATSGSSSATQNLTLSNTGNATLTVTGLALGGTNPSAFTQTNTCAATLAAGANCSIVVTFKPATTGTFTATVVATDNSGSTGTATTTQTAALSGTATAALAPQAALTPATASYGSITVGTTAAAQLFTLTNAGTAALPITSVGLTGANASSFTLGSNTCGTSLAAGGACTVSIGFSPATVGSFAATLTVVDSVGTQTSALTGAAVAAPAPQAALTPAVASFGSLTAGTVSAAQTFTLTNAGTAALSITSVTLAGANVSSFTVAANTCGTSLAAGASCTVNVSFNPAAAGSFTATLTVTDSVGTQTASLSGAATASATPADFTVTATPPVQSSYRGANVTYTVQLASLAAANPFINAVALTVTGLPAGATASFAPATLVPGTSQPTTKLTVTIPPLAADNQSDPSPKSGGRGLTLSLACLIGGLLFQRKRRMPRLLAVLLLCGLGGLATLATGCGSATGFAIPSSTSTLTITGTSGSTTHATTVTLTVE